MLSEKFILASELPDKNLASSRTRKVNEPDFYQWSIPLEQNLPAPSQDKRCYFREDRHQQAVRETCIDWINLSKFGKVCFLYTNCQACTGDVFSFFIFLSNPVKRVLCYHFLCMLSSPKSLSLTLSDKFHLMFSVSTSLHIKPSKRKWQWGTVPALINYLWEPVMS